MTNLRLRYQTVEFDETDVHLCTLRDRQQFHDPEGVAELLGISSATWPIFGVIWPSSLALAQFMQTYSIEEKRILEVGCGIALPSLLLNARRADITATDYHPEVEAFLIRNTCLNNGAAIAYEQADWASEEDQLGVFDLIIGSDLLYEDQHIELLGNFIDAHSKPRCEVILVDPGRGRKSKMISKMEQLGYSCSYQKLPPETVSTGKFKGHILKFAR